MVIISKKIQWLEIRKTEVPKNCAGKNEDEDIDTGMKSYPELDFSVIVSSLPKTIFPFIIETMYNDRTYLYIFYWDYNFRDRVLKKFWTLFSILKRDCDVWIISVKSEIVYEWNISWIYSWNYFCV